MPVPGEPYNPWRMFNGYYISNAVSRCVELSARSKLVFGRLCQYAGENGEAFPSYRSLAKEVGVQRRSAINAVRELERFGLIKAVQRWQSDGSMASNSYIFLWHKIFCDQPDIRGGEQNDTRGSVQCNTTPPCTSKHQVVTQLTPKEIQTKDSLSKKTTIENIRRLLQGTPLSTISNRELYTMLKRHGEKQLHQAADIAAETWRRDRGDIHNPGGYLHTVCNTLVVPGWYRPVEKRQVELHAVEKRKKAEQEQSLKEKMQQEQRETCLDAYWLSLDTKKQNEFIKLVEASHPTLRLPTIAIVATAKTLAWDQKPPARLLKTQDFKDKKIRKRFG